MKLTAEVRTDEFTDYVSKIFDYPFDGKSEIELPSSIPVPDDYSIGLIVGPSGSGKSTLLRTFGVNTQIEWEPTKAICSQFSSANDAVDRLSAVGLNSIPAWVKPFHVLSTGEKFRADLARRISNGCTIDEFTSVVDRTVAKATSRAVARHIRGNNLSKCVFASCHYDIIDWLEPDWVYDTSVRQFMPSRGLERRPKIVLEITPCSREAWSIFKEHHYLDGNLNKSSRCWLATWGDNVVGFAAALAFPSAHIQNAWREHRTVVLPDYQGLGLGTRLSDAVAEMFVLDGGRYFSKTSHPRMGEYREKSPLWKPTSKNKRARTDYSTKHKTKEDAYKMRHANRVCYSHEYIGGL